MADGVATPSGEDGKKFRPGRSQGSSLPRSEERLRVFFHLLWKLKELVVNRVFFELANICIVIATDFRANGINPAAAVRLQFRAGEKHQEVPLPIVHKNRCPLVKEEPANCVELLPSAGAINRQSDVMTALGWAVEAKRFSRRNVLPP
jgi:hypothetical protein